MTNEEALVLIRRADYCYVVWSLTSNEVVAVHALPKDSSGRDLLTALSNAGTHHDGPTKGRFLDPSGVSMQTLQDEQREVDRVQQRIRIFRSWQESSTEDLLLLLEHGAFPAPMDSFHGARHIIDQIYYARSGGLSDQQLQRLDSLAARQGNDALEPAVKAQLELRLAVLREDPERLVRFWRSDILKKDVWGTWIDFTTAAGDTQLAAPDVVDDFIDKLGYAGPFELRFRAMLALGKIGAPAGEQAVHEIRRHIYDSSEYITALRRQIIFRIQTPSEMWVKCTACTRGVVPRISESIPSFVRCTTCFGLGHVLTEAGETYRGLVAEERKHHD